MNPVNEQFKQRMAALFGDGYDYTLPLPRPAESGAWPPAASSAPKPTRAWCT